MGALWFISSCPDPDTTSIPVSKVQNPRLDGVVRKQGFKDTEFVAVSGFGLGAYGF